MTAVARSNKRHVEAMAEENERLRADLEQTQAALRAVAEHAYRMDRDVSEDWADDREPTEHERAVRELVALLDNDAVRLATGETCQPGQPWSCGDAHTAGHCVRPTANDPRNGATIPAGATVAEAAAIVQGWLLENTDSTTQKVEFVLHLDDYLCDYDFTTGCYEALENELPAGGDPR
jgi:hypothetical protein